MSLNARERARRFLATPPHHRRRPFDINYVTAALLAYALGLTDEKVSDRDFAFVYKEGQENSGAFPEEALQTPLVLARVAALIREGRDEDAAELLGPDPHAEVADEPPADEPPAEGGEEPSDPAGEPDAPLGADTEVVQPEDGDQGTADPTPLPDDFPMAATLIEHGFDTVDAVEAAADEALLDLPGVGAAKVALIRAAVEAARQ